MATTSSYLKYLPAVFSSSLGPAGAFSFGTMLCPFEKILTGINDGIVITHGDNSVLTTVTQVVLADPQPQTVYVSAGTGTRLRAGSSYTYLGVYPEVIHIAAATPNTVTAVFRENHAANQLIINSSGPHSDIQSVIAKLVTFYGAWTTPRGYLDYLAQWVALQLDPAWDEYQSRTVLSQIVGIYTQRGTKPGFDTFFDIYAIAKQRPRVVVDNDSKLLFSTPQPGRIVPISTLVAQKPMVAPQCLTMDPSGYLLVGDLGSSDATINPAVWRISTAGEYDHAAGPPPFAQPFQNATAPIAVAADAKNGGAYLIDLILDFVLYRLASPLVGTVTLSGGPPTTGHSTVLTVGGVSYSLAETTGNTLTQQAAAWVTTLNSSASFNPRYASSSTGAVISIAPASGPPSNDLTLVTSSATVTLQATGPHFGVGAVFASDASMPPLGLKFPTAMVVNGAGHPLILDRGALPTAASATAIVDVEIAAGPTYNGTLRHAFASISEPISLLQRGDGSLLVGDAGSQNSAAPADIVAVDPNTWTATSLLGSVPVGSNPLVAPTGIVEVDTQHLMVLDAGLRPFRPSVTAPFTAAIAQQAAIYGVDLSVNPPVIAQASELKALVYPRGMVGDGSGTLYVCDSGLPDLAGYSARKWRSGAQQMAVVVQFQGNPATAIYCVALAGTPTTSSQCSITIGSALYLLPETTGNSLAQQADAWAAALNGNAAFNTLYLAVSVGNVISIYAAPGTTATGVAFATGSSADITLSGGLLAMAVTLTGTPTTGEKGVVNVGGFAYALDQTTGDSTAQQAATWAMTLNATAPFNQSYIAAASGDVLSIAYKPGVVASNIPSFVTSSIHLTLTASMPPFAVGGVTLSGVPTTGESAVFNIGLLSYTLAETTGSSVALQAATWASSLNATASFKASFIATSAGAVINLFAIAAPGPSGIALSAVSSPHLSLVTASELQTRNQFLQSITDVASDEIPMQARWYLQSELSAV
jgi:phage tail-like protein